MRNLVIAIAVPLALAVGSANESQGSFNALSVKRLDGSAITSAEIDSTVTRLMHAARVMGAGIASRPSRKSRSMD